MRDKIKDVIYKAIDDVNEKLPVEGRIPKTPEAVFLGPGSPLDSLGFVNLIVTLGIRIQQETGHSVNLFNTKITTLDNNPLRNMVTLTDFIENKLKGQGV